MNTRLTAVIEQVYAPQPTRRGGKELWKRAALLSNLVDDGGKQVPPGRVGRNLDAHYKEERARASHFAMHMGAGIARQRHKMSGSPLELEVWIDQVMIPQAMDDPRMAYFQQSLSDNQINSIKQAHVKYCTREERQDYLITVRGGKIYNASDTLYHTGDKRTAFSGAGWAIYVVDHDNNFYSNTHIVNEFHHSSFMSGCPVQAAGELCVNQGTLIAITNKTGHYKAGTAELTRTLFLMKRGGVDLKNVLVGDPFRAKGKWFHGLHAIGAGGDLGQLAKDSPALASQVPPIAPKA